MDLTHFNARIKSYIQKFRGREPDIAAASDNFNEQITSLINFVLPLKNYRDIEIEMGSKTCNAADAGGTTINLDKKFGKVLWVGLSIATSTAKHATHGIGPAIVPTTFKIWVWDAAGARATEFVFWIVIGEKRNA